MGVGLGFDSLLNKVIPFILLRFVLGVLTNTYFYGHGRVLLVSLVIFNKVKEKDVTKRKSYFNFSY